MNSNLLVRLHPQGHFTPDLRSDQLAGALLYSLGVLFDQDFITEQFDRENPPFHISSLFPYFYTRSRAEVRCFPFPMLFPPHFKKKDYFTFKLFKKVNYIEESLFWKLISSTLKLEDIYQGVPTKYKIRNNCVVSSDQDIQHSSIDISYRSHNQINRLNSKSEQFYHTISRDFVNSGLFFLLKVSDPKWVTYLKAGLSFLQDQGLGGAISRGKGWFKVSYEDYHGFPTSNEPAEVHLILSLYSPRPAEIEVFDPMNSQYELIKRQSRSREGRMRKSIRFFTPGSVLAFKTPMTGPLGSIRLIEEKPPRIVWGKALTVPVRIS